MGTRPFYFFHIPKTAGSSFRCLLTRSFGPEQVSPHFVWSMLLKDPEAKRKSLYSGHFYHFLDTYIGRPTRRVTFLRNPIERAISHYRHIWGRPGHYFHDLARATTLEGFLEVPAARALLCDFQTRSLLLGLNGPSIEELVSTTPEAMPDAPFPLERRIECEVETGFESIGDQQLEAAWSVAESFEFVGLTERFQESIEEFSAVTGWRTNGELVRLNEAAHLGGAEFVPTADQVERLRQLNCLDLELHARSIRMFERNRRRPRWSIPGVPTLRRSFGRMLSWA